MSRIWTPASPEAPPDSFQNMWAWSPMITSSPRSQCASIATKLLMVPLAISKPASLPSRAAAFSWRRLIDGSSPYTSSPTSDWAIALRISSVGLVTVSLLKSIKLIHRPSIDQNSRTICDLVNKDCGTFYQESLLNTTECD